MITSLLRLLRFLATAALLLEAPSAALLFAQQGPSNPPATTTLTVTTRLVVLDVTATDAAGHPVTDLTQNDFRVYDGDEPRPIRAFDPPQSHALAAEASGSKESFDPARPRSFGQAPVMVLILDQLNTHFADSSFARRELRAYLAHQPQTLAQPTNLLTLFDRHFHELAPFTRNRDALLKALDTAPVQNAWTLEQDGNSESGPLNRLQQSLEALEQIAQQYARIPGRKNLLWVGGGFPSPDPTTIDGADALTVRNTLRYVTDLLLDTRVTLFAVDPSSSAAGLTEITSIEQSNFAMAAGGLSAGIDTFNASEDFDRLAPVTGGRIVSGRNDLEQQISAAVSLSDTYYTIAYQPPPSGAGTDFRHIRVECLRPGVRVTTRSGYYPNASAEQRTASLNEKDALIAALRGSGRWNGLRLQAERDPSSQGEYERLLLRVPAPDLTWQTESDGKLTAHVVIAAAVYSEKDKVMAQTTEAMSAATPAATDIHDPAHHADFVLTLRVPPHAGHIRLAVEDRTSGRIGALDLP
jgi:VWFA-related protein